MSRHHKSLNQRRWKAVRRAVFDRDGWRCVLCGRPGALECDHVTPLEREPGQDPWDLNGLQTLCRACHLEKTTRENTRAPGPKALAWRAFRDELGG